MSFLAEFVGWVREAIADKASEPVVDRLSVITWLGLPIGGVTAFALVIGLRYASYQYWDEPEYQKQIVTELQRRG